MFTFSETEKFWRDLEPKPKNSLKEKLGWNVETKFFPSEVIGK